MTPRRALALGGAAAAALLLAPVRHASAHPLGNFTINTAAAIAVTPGELRIAYAVDHAEIPTFQLQGEIDADDDRIAEPRELQAWADRRGEELRSGLLVGLDGEELSLTLRDAFAMLRPGEGGLRTLRLDAVYVAPIGASGRLRFADVNEIGTAGWREVTAVGEGGRSVKDSSVPGESLSDHLWSYPDFLLRSPPDVRLAELSFEPGPEVVPVPSGGGRGPTATSPLSSFLTRSSLSPGVVAVALALAAGVGALHALAPGHGKTITAAYIAGSGARIRQALALSLAVASMHTASVLAIGLAILALQTTFPADRVYPWLGVVAGGTALALGCGLLARRVRHRRDHARGHDHGHPASGPSRPGLTALALAGGLLPSPTAVVVLVGGLGVGRAGFGLALVAAFGLGLAASLAVVGVLAVGAREALVRRVGARVAGALPLAGAVTIAAMGAVLLVGGVIRL